MKTSMDNVQVSVLMTLNTFEVALEKIVII